MRRISWSDLSKQQRILLALLVIACIIFYPFSAFMFLGIWAWAWFKSKNN